MGCISNLKYLQRRILITKVVDCCALLGYFMRVLVRLPTHSRREAIHPESQDADALWELECLLSKVSRVPDR